MRAFRMLAVLVGVVALLGAACGGDDDGSDDEAEETEAVEETDEVTDEATDEEAEEEDDSDGGAQSVDEYAATVCGTLLDLSEQQGELVDTYNTSPTVEPVALQAETVALVDDFLADIAAGQATLEDAVPDVDDGEAIQETFVSYLDETATEVQAARDTFAAADPNGVAFAADLAIFESSLNVLVATLGDPFAEITDQDLIAAFGEEPSCEEVVTVF